MTQKVPQNDTQKQTERDTSSEQNDTSKGVGEKAEEKKKNTGLSKRKKREGKSAGDREGRNKKEKVSITIKAEKCAGRLHGICRRKDLSRMRKISANISGSQLCKIYPCGDIYAGKGNEL